MKTEELREYFSPSLTLSTPDSHLPKYRGEASDISSMHFRWKEISHGIESPEQDQNANETSRLAAWLKW